jgi:hypothetical protein
VNRKPSYFDGGLAELPLAGQVLLPRPMRATWIECAAREISAQVGRMELP